MMDIREVRMAMAQRLMRVLMYMRLFAIPIRIVLVLMMSIMLV